MQNIPAPTQQHVFDTLTTYSARKHTPTNTCPCVWCARNRVDARRRIQELQGQAQVQAQVQAQESPEPHTRQEGPAGTKHDSQKPKWSLLPYDALLPVVRVMEYGAAKYGRDNWMAGMEWTRLADAAVRHLLDWLRGEDNDRESGLPHLAHAACNLLFLLAYTLRGLGKDDRTRY